MRCTHQTWFQEVRAVRRGSRWRGPGSTAIALGALAGLFGVIPACSSRAPSGATSTDTEVSTSPKGPPASIDPSNEVWAVTNQWSDTDPSSGLTFEQKFDAWVASFPQVPTADGSSTTIQIVTPYGKSMPGPALECAEVANTLRVLFASYNHLPFFLVGWDSTHHQPLFAGHFGFVDPSGQTAPGMPAFKTRYADDEPTYNAGDPWPSDPALRQLHLGSDDTNTFLSDQGGAGAYFDEVVLNKRVGYFLRLLLLNFSSEDLVNGGNMFQIQPTALSTGDVLFERWQAQGIGHTIPVFQVDSTTYPGKLAPSIATGSMPRRQPLWDGPLDARTYFTNDETGGTGTASDGTGMSYAQLGGGLHRWRTAAVHSGRWVNDIPAVDQSVAIADGDLADIGARPQAFDALLALGTPADRRDAAIRQIQTARDHLRSFPASCSARSDRESAFQMLYGALNDLQGTAQTDVDAQYRTLEDYVFAELDYTQSKTCCWDTTTSAMAQIVLDQANVEQTQGQANGQCVEPTVFRAMASSGDGYDLWRNHAQAMGRASDWHAWEQDETCPGANVTEDSLGPDQTDYCATLASQKDAGADAATGDDGGGSTPSSP